VHSPSGSTDDPSQDPSSVTASIIDLSKMTITPVVNPDFRRRAFERFVYDFVLPDSPTRPKDEPSDALWTFIPVLYQGASDDSLIAMAVDAVAYVNFSNRCNDPHAATLGEECVAKAIPMLTKVIADKKQSATNEALCSVYLMGVYEVFGIRLATSDLLIRLSEPHKRTTKRHIHRSSPWRKRSITATFCRAVL
jgi:hypothetical protein